MKRLSGDQNGNAAPSVPLSGRASLVSSDRTHNLYPLGSFATNTTCFPSGDTASCDATPEPADGSVAKLPSDGGAMVNSMTSPGAGAARNRAATTPSAADATETANNAAQVRRLDLPGGERRQH